MLINESRLKTPIILRNTIIFYVNCQLAKENISTHTFLYDNFNISKFNSKLKKCLDSIKVFINQSIELKTADRVITISKKLNFLQEDLIKIINKMDLKVGGSTNEGNTNKDKEVSKMIDQNKKNIASVCQYNLTISRFILETLLNTRFVQMLLSGNQSKLSLILTDDCFRFVPSIENEIGTDGKIGYQHKWTDEELYEKYNITEKEQRDIESYVNRRENYGLVKEKKAETGNY